ncbi:MAG: hypothetical protein AAGC70_02715 [Pseudomonadota bacterium]
MKEFENSRGRAGNHPTQLSDDELATLLPFFLSGRITSEDRSRVIDALNARPDATDILAHAESELSTVQGIHERIPAPEGALDRLLAKVEETPQEKARAVEITDRIAKSRGWLASLLDFGGARPALAWGVAACLLVTTVFQAGLLLRPDAPQKPVLASGGATNACADAVCAMVRFQPNVSFSQVTSLLEGVSGTIVTGPRRGSLYTVRFSKDQSEVGLDRLRSSTDIVARVIPMRVQSQ